MRALSRACGEVDQGGPGDDADVETPHSMLTQADQLQAKMIAPGRDILFDHGVVLHGHQDAVSGGLVQAGSGRDLTDVKLRRRGGKTVQDRDGPVDRLDPVFLAAAAPRLAGGGRAGDFLIVIDLMI